MSIANLKQVNDLEIWFMKQLTELYTAMGTMDYSQEEAEFQWPMCTLRLHEPDVEATINISLKQFALENTSCALIDLENKVKSLPRNIDYFFYKMHFLGHHLLKRTVLTKSMDNLNEAAFKEVTCHFFGTIMCHHYYKLEDLSPLMVQEIIGAIIDQNKVVKARGKQFDLEDNMKMVKTLVKQVLDRDLFLLQ